MPSISVVMPFLNCERFIDLAISSVREQTLSDFELIVVDDGSTDRSAEIAAQHAASDSRIRLIRGPHRGVAAARNLGVEAAHGMFIANMDADDVSLPQRFWHQLEFLTSNPKVVAISGAYNVIDESGMVVAERLLPSTPDAVRDALRRGGCPLCSSATMIRREVLMRAGGYRSQMDLAEDYDLWLRLIKIGQMSNLSQKVLLYRIHTSSCTYSKMTLQFSAILKAIIWDKGIHDDMQEKTIEELLLVAADRGIPEFLLNRACGYPVTMAELGHFKEAVGISHAFSRHVSGRDSDVVLWNFLLRSVGAAAVARSRTAALALLARFLCSPRVGLVAVKKKEELRQLLLTLVARVGCRATQSEPPKGPFAGHVDLITWKDGGRKLSICGWAKFPIVGANATFLVHLPAGCTATAIERTMRPDVAEAIGEENLFSGFEITIDCSQCPFHHPAFVSILSRDGQVFSLDSSAVSVCEDQ